jgi:tetratricopeptide (TPR) repeat protein
MREQKRRAFEGWLGREVAARPLLIVLEDLHWGDAVTAGYFESAFRALTDLPFMVLALARPELHEQLPNLFEVRGAQEIRLAGLTRRAAERLVGAVIGSNVASATVSKIVEQADGNAFYLEELIRRVAEGDMELPETVVAMAQSRLERLEPDARRVLRAASVFGEAFWVGGVAALIADPIDVGACVEKLVEREVLVPRSGSRFANETECNFRHALLRDAAYAMLTDEDRRQGHRLAGAWLEWAGEPEPGIMAHHFEQAGERLQALTWLSRAGEMAFARSAYRDAVAYFNRAIATLSAIPDGGDRITQELGLQIRLGQALFTLRGYGSTEHHRAFRRARELCSELGDSADSTTTLVLLGLWGSNSVLGNLAGSYEAAGEALRLAERTGRQSRLCWAHLALGTTLLHMGNVANGRDHLTRSVDLYVEARHATEPTEDPGAMALCHLARATWLGGRPGVARRLDAESLALVQRLQKPLDISSALIWSAILAALMNEPVAALAKATAAIQAAQELGLPQRVLEGRSVRAWALAALGSIAEGLEEMQTVHEIVSTMVGTPMHAVPHHVFLAETLLRAERFERGIATVEALLSALNGWNLERANLVRTKGDLLLGLAIVSGEQTHADGAERSYRDAMEDAREQGAFAYELRAAIRLSRVLTSRNTGGEGRQFLERALSTFRGPDETADTIEAKQILGL